MPTIIPPGRSNFFEIHSPTNTPLTNPPTWAITLEFAPVNKKLMMTIIAIWHIHTPLIEPSYSRFLQLNIKKPSAVPNIPKIPVEAPIELDPGPLTATAKTFPIIPIYSTSDAEVEEHPL